MTSQKIIRLVLGLLSLVALGALCAWLFQEEVRRYGTFFVDAYGLWGIAIGTLICDTSPIPLTNEPLALIAIGADIPLWQIIITMSAASHCGAPVGYTCGLVMGKQSWFQALVQRKYPDALEKGRPYAIRAVALGAVLPIPYAITTWAAGAMKAGFWKTCLAGSLRWIKNAVTVSIIAGGWIIGQG